MGKVKGKEKVDKKTKVTKKPKKEKKSGKKSTGKLSGLSKSGTVSSETMSTVIDPAEKKPGGKFKKCLSKIKSIDPLVIILLIIVLLATGLAAIALFWPASKSLFGSSADDVPFCTSGECAIAANMLLENIDPEADPCDDFYKSACGKFTESNIPNDKAGSSGAGMAHSLADEELKRMFNSTTSKSEAENIAKIIYKECVKSANDLKPLYAEFKKLGGFPALDKNWDPNTFDLTNTILGMARVMPDQLGIFKLRVRPSAEIMTSRYSLVNIVEYSPAINAKTSESTFKSEFLSVLNSMAESNSLPTENLTQDIEKVLKLDMRIHEAAPTELDKPNIKERIPPISGFDTEKFLKELFPYDTRKEKNAEEDILILTLVQGDYFVTKLNEILKETDVRDIQNYLVFRFLGYLGYSQLLSDDEAARQVSCISKTSTLIPGTVAVAHAIRKIKKENIRAAEKMVEDLKESFIEEFEKNEWMDDQSKKKAIQKVKDMEYNVGYPKRFQDEQNVYLKNLFKKFDFSPTDTFCEMAVKVYSSYSKDYFLAPLKNETIGYGVEILLWNAKYLPYTNSLKIATLPLRAPWFDASLPEYFNLGTIGFVTGHEIGHGFHPIEDAKVWSKTTLKRYKKKSECFIKRFDNFELHGEKVNGERTLHENIADSLGLKTSYRTMKKKLAGKENDEILRLPGLEKYTPEQLFFYGLASPWCGFPVEGHQVQRALADLHTPDRLRMNGLMMNSEEFAETFKCKIREEMHRKRKKRKTDKPSKVKNSKNIIKKKSKKVEKPSSAAKKSKQPKNKKDGKKTTGKPTKTASGVKKKKEEKRAVPKKAKSFCDKLKLIDPILMISVMIGLLAIGVLAINFFVPETESKSKIVPAPTKNKSSENSTEVAFCTTAECAHAAAFVLEQMDPEVDPCENFFLAACGKFFETRVFQEDRVIYGAIGREKILSDIEMKNMMNSKVSKSEAEKKAKIIYKSCLKTADQTTGLYEAIQKIGGFPGYENWNEDNFDLTNSLIAMAQISPENVGFFKLDVIEQRGKLITLMQYLPASFAISVREPLKKMVRDIAEAESITLRENLDDIIDEVAKLDWQIYEARPQVTIHYVPIIARMGNFNMAKFCKNVIPKKTREKEKIRKDVDILVANNPYFKKNLNEILQDKSPQVLQAYLVTRLIMHMNDSYLDVGEPTKIDKRQDFCLTKLKDLIPGTIGVAHAMRKIKKESIAVAEKMIEDAKESFIEEFEKNTWMDSESKKKAIEKIKDIESYVGYPKYFGDEKNVYLKKLFKKFNFAPSDSFIQMVLKIHSSYSADFFLAPFRNETLGFESEIFQLNANYRFDTNTFTIQSLSLKMPFFGASLPDYYNFGTVGKTIGHEIGHGYHPDEGAEVWSAKTLEHYKKKADCLIDQFDNYELEGRKVDGKLTLNENVADLFGVKISLKTLKKRMAKKKRSEILKMPGMENFSPEQIFFYSLASKSCEAPTKPDGVKLSLEDVHAPSKFRLLSMVANSEDFAKAFNCKPNSKMNPKKKCKIL